MNTKLRRDGRGYRMFEAERATGRATGRARIEAVFATGVWAALKSRALSARGGRGRGTLAAETCGAGGRDGAAGVEARTGEAGDCAEWIWT